MEVHWYRQDPAAVQTALGHGERPELATTMACRPLDELVALHDELGIFAILDTVEVDRLSAGLSDGLLPRTPAVLPFVAAPSLSGAAAALFREPAILLRLGWAPVALRDGTHGRHRNPDGRRAESLPCHPDTLLDALRRIGEAAWAQAQRAGVGVLFARRLVRVKSSAIDGSGLGADLRVVALVCVSGTRPLIVAWCLLTGTASEKGKEAWVNRALVEQALALGGPGTIRLLLADGLYADGPLLTWLKCVQGIDAVVRLPADRCLYQELEALVAGGGLDWRTHRETRTVRGHKMRHPLEVAGLDGLTRWDSFVAAAAGYGRPDADAAVQAYRARWHIENDGDRELKEGWGLETARWGRDAAAVRGRLTLTCLAFNTAQIYRSRAGERVAALGIRRLRQQYRHELGAAPVVIYLNGCYGVFLVEEVLTLLGARSAPASSRGAAPPRLDILSPNVCVWRPVLDKTFEATDALPLEYPRCLPSMDRPCPSRFATRTTSKSSARRRSSRSKPTPTGQVTWGRCSRSTRAASRWSSRTTGWRRRTASFGGRGTCGARRRRS
jgi:hypothetical protein